MHHLHIRYYFGSKHLPGINSDKTITRHRTHKNVTNPVCGGKIDGFGKVVSLVEASVVSTRAGDNYLTRMLVCSHHLATKQSKY